MLVVSKYHATRARINRNGSHCPVPKYPVTLSLIHAVPLYSTEWSRLVLVSFHVPGASQRLFEFICSVVMPQYNTPPPPPSYMTCPLPVLILWQVNYYSFAAALVSRPSASSSIHTLSITLNVIHLCNFLIFWGKQLLWCVSGRPVSWICCWW